MTRRNSELQGGKRIAAADEFSTGQEQAASKNTRCRIRPSTACKVDGVNVF